MNEIVIIGSGKIGEMLVDMLANNDDYHVTLVDSSLKQLVLIPDRPGLTKLNIDVTDRQQLETVLRGKFAVLSACPYYLNKHIIHAAVAAGTHYLDLTEDVASAEEVKKVAHTADTAFIPQCGLAPGFISIITNHIASKFDELDSIRMRVGALPQYPSNSLNYNLTWSTDGVINEYCEPCIAIVNGELCNVRPLEQLEEFSLDGIRYESFNTSGGLGTLGETLLGKVRNLNYQTIRYPGHRDIMKTLLLDLRLAERREVLKDVLENAVPTTMQDVVLIFVTVSGKQNNKFIQETYANKIYSARVNQRIRSAIQITTAAGICTMLDLLMENKLPQTGFIKQEQVSLDDFLNNRFGKYYKEKPTESRAA